MINTCRHVIDEPNCVGCYYRNVYGPLPTNCQHALKETWCFNCKGADHTPPSPTEPRRVPLRRQIIQATSQETKEAIKSWRERWRSLAHVVCHWCQQTFDPEHCHADHVIPLSRGGEHSLSNLVIACARCNLRKNARLPEVWSGMVAAI